MQALCTKSLNCVEYFFVACVLKIKKISRLGKAIEDFSLEDFPLLHPMVVHLPVIMIPVALLFGLISIFFTNRHLVLLAPGFAAVGATALFKPIFLSKGLFALILLLGSFCVSLTAYYGGTLTYVHGVGVNRNYLDAHW